MSWILRSLMSIVFKVVFVSASLIVVLLIVLAALSDLTERL
jgi:hypothetical protein